MVDTVHVRYERVLDQPLDEAYAWLTDYREDDPERAGAIVTKRKVVEADEDTVVLDAQVETLGKARDGGAVVELDPPDHWTAHVKDHKGRDAGLYDYRLEPIDDGRCKLVVDYNMAAPKFTHKLMLTLAKPLVKRQIDKMWDGFIDAMDEELGEAQEPAQTV